MPEVPLWKLKIDGQEYPPPQEGDESETQLVTPPEEEFPHEVDGLQEWYDSKKKEYAEFLKSPEALTLDSNIKTFLSKPDNKAFVRQLRTLRGPGAWLVLRTFFDKCTDSTLIDEVASQVWKPALEWLQHEKHRQITMIEMNDLWRSLEDIDRSPPPEVEPEESPLEPEFDDNFRFIGRGDEE
jgi:hypothetical protein